MRTFVIAAVFCRHRLGGRTKPDFGLALLILAAHLPHRLWGGDPAAWLVFWGYQFFILMAAWGYVTGVTRSREYAEPEWCLDIWLMIVWVTYLLIFVGTILKRQEPHI